MTEEEGEHWDRCTWPKRKANTGTGVSGRRGRRTLGQVYVAEEGGEHLDRCTWPKREASTGTVVSDGRGRQVLGQV